MARFRGGESVGGGIYLNKRTGEVINLIRTGGVLPQGGETEYIKVPAAAMLICGPLIGLAYVVFLPFIAFGMLVWFGMERLIHAAAPMHERVVGMAAPAWSPAEAHLDGKVKTASGKAEEEGEETARKGKTEPLGDLLANLEKEIEQKRKRDK